MDACVSRGCRLVVIDETMTSASRAETVYVSLRDAASEFETRR
jgi:hypothetical protein